MPKVTKYREQVIKGLLQRIEYAARNDRKEEEIANVVNVIEVKLADFAREDQIVAFFEGLEDAFKGGV